MEINNLIGQTYSVVSGALESNTWITKFTRKNMYIKVEEYKVIAYTQSVNHKFILTFSSNLIKHISSQFGCKYNE